MATKKTAAEIEQNPSKGSIQMLFRELNDLDIPEKAAMTKARKVKEELKERLLNVPEMIEAEKAEALAEEIYYDKRKETEAKVSKVRREYLTKGLTPGVRRKIEALVAEINGEPLATD